LDRRGRGALAAVRRRTPSLPAPKTESRVRRAKRIARRRLRAPRAGARRGALESFERLAGDPAVRAFAPESLPRQPAHREVRSLRAPSPRRTAPRAARAPEPATRSGNVGKSTSRTTPAGRPRPPRAERYARGANVPARRPAARLPRPAPSVDPVLPLPAPDQRPPRAPCAA